LPPSSTPASPARPHARGAAWCARGS
jgi:hypothetical protein